MQAQLSSGVSETSLSQRDQDFLNTPAMKSLIGKFQDESAPIGLQDLNNIIRKIAPISPALAISLIAARQNTLSTPLTPAHGVRALLGVASRYNEVAETAFSAVLKNSDESSKEYALDFINLSLVENPVEKIENSDPCFREALLGELIFVKSGYAGSQHLGPHTESAIQSLCRIGGEKAEQAITAKIDRLERAYSSSAPLFAPIYAAFPALAQEHQIDLIVEKFRREDNASSAISALSDLNDGQMVDHLETLSKYGSAKSRPFIIYALAELQTDEAADAVYVIAKYNPENRLDALGALGSMRREEASKGTNDLSTYDSRIQALLHQTLDLEMLQQTLADTRAHYRDFFNHAAKEGSVPENTAKLFARAVAWVDEEDALTATIDNLEPVEPVSKRTLG